MDIGSGFRYWKIEEYTTQNIFTKTTRWLYCAECPQYSTQLKVLGYLCDCLSGRVQTKQVFKVIWHKVHRRRRQMVQCYSTGDENMSFHEGTLASPGEYDWTCTSFGPLDSITEMANGSAEPFCTAYSRRCLYCTMGAPIHQNCPFPWGIWTLHVTHDALGPCEPTTKTAPRSVQPCLHRWPQTVPILYNGLPVFPSKLSLPTLASGPHVIHGSLGPTQSGTQMATWSFQLFCRAH